MYPTESIAYQLHCQLLSVEKLRPGTSSYCFSESTDDILATREHLMHNFSVPHRMPEG
jgi:hypothetical protein